jgi:hypothetical protein
MSLDTVDGIPVFTVRPDSSKPVLSVNVFYTQQGIANERPEDREHTMHRFWHHAPATETDGDWIAKLPLSGTDQLLWVYANVAYPLDEPVMGAGYYYGTYTADSFNVSSLIETVDAGELRAAGSRATLTPSLLIEDFEGDWEREWFTYNPEEWSRTTHKLYDETWQAPPNAMLALDIQSTERNTLAVLIDGYAAEVQLTGGDDWQSVALLPHDFHEWTGESLPSWENIRRLKLCPNERLSPLRGEEGEPRSVGAMWQGAPPRFRNLRWQIRPQ